MMSTSRFIWPVLEDRPRNAIQVQVCGIKLLKQSAIDGQDVRVHNKPINSAMFYFEHVDYDPQDGELDLGRTK